MIAGLLLAQILAGPATPAPPVVPTLKPAAVLERYAVTLAKIKEPRVFTFDYTLDQTGTRTLAQTHRVFRSGSDERDETLTVDGKRLTPPKVRIFRGRRNRYTITALAPRLADYDFTFVGPRKNAHHFDYVFRVTPKLIAPFSITDVTIDGVRFLPAEIAFVTGPNDGSGSISFGRNAGWWVPYFASARAMVAASIASEKLSFYTYRFPPSLPPATFGRAHSRDEELPRTTPTGMPPILAPRYGPQPRPVPGSTLPLRALSDKPLPKPAHHHRTVAPATPKATPRALL